MRANVQKLYSAKCPLCNQPLSQYLHVDEDGLKVICIWCHARFRCDLEPDGFEPEDKPK